MESYKEIVDRLIEQYKINEEDSRKITTMYNSLQRKKMTGLKKITWILNVY